MDSYYEYSFIYRVDNDNLSLDRERGQERSYSKGTGSQTRSVKSKSKPLKQVLDVVCWVFVFSFYVFGPMDLQVNKFELLH